MPTLNKCILQITLLILVHFAGFSQLTISSVSPLIVERFDTVSITGTGLSATTAVFFGNQPAKSFLAESDILLKAVINHGAAGKVKVKTATAEAESSESLLVSYNSDILFVGSFNEDSLNVIHPEDGKVIGKIRLPRSVEYFCILPNNKVAYASDPVKDSLYEISLTEWRVLRQVKVDDITAIEYNPVNKNLMVARVRTIGGVNITISGMNLETLTSESEMVYASATNHPNIASSVTNDKIYFNPADSLLWFARNVTTGTYIFNARLSVAQPQITIRFFHSRTNPNQIYGFTTLKERLITLSLGYTSSLTGWRSQLIEMDSIGRSSGLGNFANYNNTTSVSVLASSRYFDRLYSCDYVKNVFQVIDPFVGFLFRKTLNIGKLPSAIGISTELKNGYTLNRTDSNISIINLETEVITKTIKPGFQPKNYEGQFVANYDPNYKLPEISHLSAMVGAPNDTISVFGKNLNYVSSIKIGKSYIGWFIKVNDSTIRMAIPKGTSGLLYFLSKEATIQFDTLRVCYPNGVFEHNGLPDQLVCQNNPFSFVVTKNTFGSNNNVNWSVNNQIKGKGNYFTSYFLKGDSIKSNITIDTGNCRGYIISSNISIINTDSDSLHIITFPNVKNKNQAFEINTENKRKNKLMDYPLSFLNDSLTYSSIIDINKKFLYILGPKFSNNISIIKFNLFTRTIELSEKINQYSELQSHEIALGNQDKFIYINMGNRLLIYTSDSLKLSNTINFTGGIFRNLKNDQNYLSVSRAYNSGGSKLQHILIDTITKQIAFDFHTGAESNFIGYSFDYKYRQEHSNSKIFEYDLEHPITSTAFNPNISNISFAKNSGRTSIFSDESKKSNNNAGLFNFDTKTVKYYPFLIKDATSITTEKFSVICEDNSKIHLRIIDRKTLNTIDSISLPDLEGWNVSFGSPFMQSYTLSRPPCSNKIRLCNGLPNSGMVIEKLEGSSYQWQLSTDGGVSFSNLENGANYSGTNARQLNLINLPDAVAGNQYQCIVDGKTGESHLLAFENTWKQGNEGNWEDPANWSCGILPGPTTDVIIFSGSVKINSDITVKSLQIMPGVEFELAPGVQITLTNE